jgi:DNA-binding beta-propeller fold protein YncE
VTSLAATPLLSVPETAYVTTAAGIVEVDLATGHIVRRIVTAGNLFALDPIAVAPDDRTVYAVSDNVLTSIDVATGRIQATLTFGPATGGLADGSGLPSSIAIAPDGRTAYVAVPAYGTLIPINLAPLSAGRPIHLAGQPFQVAIAPDGETAYVPDSSSSEIEVVNLATGGVEAPITGIDTPHEIAIASNGRSAYVSAGGINTVPEVVPIDLTTGAVGQPVALGGPSHGYVPGPITVSADGRTVSVADADSGANGAQVSVLRTSTDTVIARFNGFSGPVGLTLVGGSPTLLVANMAASGDGGRTLGSPRTRIDGNALVPINMATRQVGSSIPLPTSPRALAVASS